MYQNCNPNILLKRLESCLNFYRRWNINMTTLNTYTIAKSSKTDDSDWFCDYKTLRLVSTQPKLKPNWCMEVQTFTFFSAKYHCRFDYLNMLIILFSFRRTNFVPFLFQLVLSVSLLHNFLFAHRKYLIAFWLVLHSTKNI